MTEYQLVNIVSEQKIICEQKWLDLIERETLLIKESGHKLAANYDMKRLDLSNHLSFDIVVDVNNLVGWSGLYNGGRFPPGVFRIMNRTYTAPQYRTTVVLDGGPTTKLIYPYQKSKYMDQIKLLFVSRDDPKGKYFLSKWCKEWAGEEGWQVSDNMVQLCPWPKRGCHQYVAFKEYQLVEWKPNKITEEEWYSLEE